MRYIHLVILISILSFSCRNRKSNLWLHVPKRRRFDKQVSQDPSQTATTPTYTPKQPNLQILNSGKPRKKKKKKKQKTKQKTKKKKQKKKKKKKNKKNARIRCVSYSYKMGIYSRAVVSVPICCTSTLSLADNNHSYSIRFLFVKPQSHCHVLRVRFYYVVKRNENVLHTTIYAQIWLHM